MAKEMNRGTGPIMSTDALKRNKVDTQAGLTHGMGKALGKSNSSVSGKLCKCPSALFLEHRNLIKIVISELTISAFLPERQGNAPEYLT